MAKPVTVLPKSTPKGLRLDLFNKKGLSYLRVVQGSLKLLIPLSNEKLNDFRKHLLSGKDEEEIHFSDPKKQEYFVYFTVYHKVSKRWINISIYEGDVTSIAWLSERQIQILSKFAKGD